jgi:hypothetical protein
VGVELLILNSKSYALTVLRFTGKAIPAQRAEREVVISLMPPRSENQADAPRHELQPEDTIQET